MLPCHLISSVNPLVSLPTSWTVLCTTWLPSLLVSPCCQSRSHLVKLTPKLLVWCLSVKIQTVPLNKVMVLVFTPLHTVSKVDLILLVVSTVLTTNPTVVWPLDKLLVLLSLEVTTAKFLILSTLSRSPGLFLMVSPTTELGLILSVRPNKLPEVLMLLLTTLKIPSESINLP